MKMQLAENYMAMHPNVNIEFEYTDGNGYLTKMQTCSLPAPRPMSSVWPATC